MDQRDRQYYLDRIAAEEMAARRATHPAVAETHRKLAEEYASLLIANEQAPRPRSASA